MVIVNEVRQLPRRRRYKYGVAPAAERTVDGIVFASKREADEYATLKILKKGGAVKWFCHQPRFVLPGGVEYVADFVVVWSDGRVTAEDVKGVGTALYRVKMRQVEAIHGIEVEEVE